MVPVDPVEVVQADPKEAEAPEVPVAPKEVVEIVETVAADPGKRKSRKTSFRIASFVWTARARLSRAAASPARA